MYKIRNQLLCWGLLLCFSQVSAQIIRKDHREMTPGEKQTFMRALITNVDFMLQQAEHHATHFNSEIHTSGGYNGSQFLSWHRLFILEIENRLRTTPGMALAHKITMPYWDWDDEDHISNIEWNNRNFLHLATLNDAGFNIRRSSMTRNTLPTATSLRNALLLTNFMPDLPASVSSRSPTFSKRIEYWHNVGHNFIGGTMSTSAAPRDPIFYLHHNTIDRLWQEWEDQEAGKKSYFPNNPDSEINFWPATNPNSITDSRQMHVNFKEDDNDDTHHVEVWFANDRYLLLNGNHYTTAVDSSRKTYCYVAWNGSNTESTIIAGDMRRDESGNIINDNKGGFHVDGYGADFYAATAIDLMPGFDVAPGAEFNAQIVSTPCGYSDNYSDNTLEPTVANNKTTTLSNYHPSHTHPTGKTKIYPNPFVDNINIEHVIEEDTPLSVELTNQLGQVVFNQDFGIVQHGRLITTIPVDALPHGLYILSIKTAQKRWSYKLMH